jgi:hypothetical protein
MAARIIYNETIHRVTFRFDSPLPRGEAQLKMSFEGSLLHNMCGFYRSSYVDKLGQQR